jgi:hypothetical protein
MSRDLFLKIMHDMMCYDDYFSLKTDATTKLCFTSYQKCSAAIMMLAYGVVTDLVDENIRVSDSGCLEVMYMFCKVVLRVFVGVYLRQPLLTPGYC